MSCQNCFLQLHSILRNKQISPAIWEWLKKPTAGQPEAKAMLLTMKTMVKAEIQIDDTLGGGGGEKQVKPRVKI